MKKYPQTECKSMTRKGKLIMRKTLSSAIFHSVSKSQLTSVCTNQAEVRKLLEIAQSTMKPHVKKIIYEWWIISDSQKIRGALLVTKKHIKYRYIVMNKF